MALKALLLKKKLDEKRTALKALQEKDAEFVKREKELSDSIGEVTAETSEEERNALDELVNSFDADKAAHEGAKAELEKVIGEMENELAEEEAAQNTEPAPDSEEPKEKRKETKKMKTRAKFFEKMDMAERSSFVDGIKGFIDETRSAIKEKRAISNIGLLIPEVMLPLLRANVLDYSKLYRHVNIQNVSGEARMPIMGAAPEAIWTECCAYLNELSLTFNDATVDCFKLGGYYAICNANLEDSDIDLAAVILDALGQSIGKALDKAILYGRNSAGKQNMPLGIVTRLAQESQPAGYPATARPWVDLHTSNIKTIANTNTGIALFQALMINGSAAKNSDYGRGEKVWVMNETTYSFLKAQAMSVNASGAIVSGIEGTMPVLGGIVEVLNFVPDYVIIGGYFDLYLLAERKGAQFASSEHVKFLQDQTVFKGTARYDGMPVIAEAFVAIGINGAIVSANAVTFDPDEANDVQSIALNTSTASVTAAAGANHTVQLFAITAPGSGTVTWSSGTEAKATVDNNGVVTGVAAGSSVITATCNGKTASCTVTVT